jgi:hypothetical protein
MEHFALLNLSAMLKSYSHWGSAMDHMTLQRGDRDIGERLGTPARRLFRVWWLISGF